MLNNRIGRKIFLYTSSMLLIIVGLFLLALFYVLPTGYNYYTSKEHERLISEIQTKMPTNSVIDMWLYIYADEDLKTHLVRVFPKDYPTYGHIKYPYEGAFSGNHNGALTPEKNNQANLAMIKYVQTSVTIDGTEYIIQIDIPPYPLDQIYQASNFFLPILFVLLILIAITLGLAITKQLSKPLLLLNQKVKEISAFNFDSQIAVNENTELGDISQALDSLSINLKKGMASLEADKNRAIENEKTRREFLAIMSHELKTPLTIIKGQNECMLDRRGVYADRDKYLYENLLIINEMEDLVKRILLSLKIDDENLELIYTDCQVDQLVLKNIEYYEQLVSEKNLQYAYQLEPTIVHTDLAMLSYALKNIIENAYFYADDNSALTIDVNANYLRITNQNKELDPALIEELFTPFKTLDRSRNRTISGSGLGLYIVKRSIETINLTFTMTKNHDIVEFIIYFSPMAIEKEKSAKIK